VIATAARGPLVCVTRLLDREAVVEKLVYVAANPVKDLLVERTVQWPGTNGYRHLLHDKALRVLAS
jgi:hypothetical protein